ncbi:MAG: FISUMP domain-containing protein, partial [Bacteroidota bacterium]
MQKAILTVCLIFLSISMFSQTQNGNDGITISKSDTNVVVTDLDGNTYPTKIMKDGKRWMTKSLNVELPDSWCYENDPSNCNNYGRLYTLEAAKKACKSLGEVWRLPSKEEWTTLALSYGGIRIFESRWIEKGNPENALNSL